MGARRVDWWMRVGVPSRWTPPCQPTAVALALAVVGTQPGKPKGHRLRLPPPGAPMDNRIPPAGGRGGPWGLPGPS
jgi:hypothetical protein